MLETTKITTFTPREECWKLQKLIQLLHGRNAGNYKDYYNYSTRGMLETTATANYSTGDMLETI